MARRRLFQRRYPGVGAAPGTFRISEGALPPRVHVMRYSAQDVTEHDELDPAAVRALVAPGYVTWIDVQGLGDRAWIERFAEAFHVHRLAVADVVNVGQRPKVEDYGTHLYVVFRMVGAAADGNLEWDQVSMFLGENYVLTLQEHYGDCLDPLRQRIRAMARTVHGAGPDYLAAQILDAAVDGYFPVLERYGEWMEELEDQIVGRPNRAAWTDLYRVRRELMGFRRAAWPLRDALSQLLREDHPSIKLETRPYLRDVVDHAMQVVDVLENYRELASSLVDVYLSSLAHRTNDVMRVLTVIATIFIPLTFLAGVYGMNFDRSSVWNMPELGWRFGYVAFWVACILTAAGLLVAFWRKGWIGGGAAPEEE